MLGQFPSKMEFNLLECFIELTKVIRTITQSVIYAGFLVEVGPQNVGGGPIFRGWNEILLLGKALKCGVIFQKIALKLIEFAK